MRNKTFETILKALENPFFEAQYLSPTVLYNRLNAKSIINHEVTLSSWGVNESPTIDYQKVETQLGAFLFAATGKGICFAAPLQNNKIDALTDFHNRFGQYKPKENPNNHILVGLNYLNNSPTNTTPVHLHVKGTPFQLNIWKKLLDIPFRSLTTYSRLGGGENYGRATGSAIGSNPVCFIIPCHRVIREGGKFDGFYWGNELKKALLVWEEFTIAPEKKISGTIRK